MTKHIYFFGSGQADAGNDLRHLVGGKGASLAEMTRAGLRVPPGFTISTECCNAYYQHNGVWPDGLEDDVRVGLRRLQELAGRPFGRGDDPLLVAVRSGAAQSMPGMMDTVLNVGLNAACVPLMGRRVADTRAAWEAYRHFLVMFGHTVAGISESVFADASAGVLRDTGRDRDEQLNADEMAELCRRLEETYRTHAGTDIPADPWQQLVEAINAVFRSWNSERAVTYRRHHGIDALLGTAVNVQMMCPSEVSGIMFTANPVNPALQQILIESSFGLGEAIVLGKVTPDRFVIDKSSLQITEREIARKEQRVATLAAGPTSVAAADAPSLDDTQIAELARLGMQVETYFGHPCDIEWGISRGDIYLLQARKIKGMRVGQDETQIAGTELGEDRERVRREEIEALRALAAPKGTVWSRFNLAEVLPEPTPMTWAIVRRFMSGRGGFGLMYRDLGFDPDPALDEIGIFDLVCGRPYCNLSREPRMQYRALPFEHPFITLKSDPSRAMYPQAVFNPASAGWRFWCFLPITFVKLFNSGRRLARISREFASHFTERIVPAYLEEIRRAQTDNLESLDAAAVVERMNAWIKRTLDDFGRESLKPTGLAALAMENLRRPLERVVPRAQAETALRELVMGARPGPETDLPGAINDLLAGRLERAAFLERFGHRGSLEMELSQPRWAEDHVALDRMSQSGNEPQPRSAQHPDPVALWRTIAGEAKLADAQTRALEADVRSLHTYMGLRESGKHYLMMGYAQIRRCLVELDRRYQLDGGLFYLTPIELAEMTRSPEGQVDARLIALAGARRRRREIALSLPVPAVIFSDDLEAIGRPLETATTTSLVGVALSAGVAEGNALVLDRPEQASTTEPGYILVCPSTDPAWVPLFVKARGLVMETGGVLSHGAIVAREFGLPAVAGIPAVQRRLRTGQRLRVNGATGEVTVLE
ncbi:MAG: hypothetical protein FJ271_11575 [Planctomycetes bacterium]|nr:hypothetical protein [Planctomycetota bacterium]